MGKSIESLSIPLYMSSGQLSPDGKSIWNGTEWVPNLPTDNSAVQTDNTKDEFGIITVDPDLLSQIHVGWTEYRPHSQEIDAPIPWYNRGLYISYDIPDSLPEELKYVLVGWAEETSWWLHEGDNPSISTLDDVFDSNTLSRLDSLWNEVKGRWHERDKTIFLGRNGQKQKQEIINSFVIGCLLIGLWFLYKVFAEAVEDVFIFNPNVELVIILFVVISFVYMIWAMFVWVIAEGDVLAGVHETNNVKQKGNRLDAGAQPKSSPAEAGSSIDTHLGDGNDAKSIVQNITYNIQDSVIQQKE